MKKTFQYLLAIILLSALGAVYLNKTHFRETFIFNFGRKIYEKVHVPCGRPITYSLGNIDPRFGISENELLELAGSAGNVWEKSAGKKLFQYDPASSFKINLIYDERQAQSVASDKLNDQLDELQSQHEAVVKDYNSLSQDLKKRLDSYNEAVRSYQKKLGQYNQNVKYWNSRGGAPEDEFGKLKNEKSELEKTFSALEKERTAINGLVGKTNSLVAEENTIVDQYNIRLDTYKDVYGGAREFDKGIYDGKGINIYQFHDNNDLMLTLAHEMGHALEIDHVENSKSIMFPILGDQDLKSPALSENDINALLSVCGLK